MEINHFNDNLAKALIKHKDIPLYLARFVLNLCNTDNITINNWYLTDTEVKNFDAAQKTMFDMLICVETSEGVYKIDVEVQAYDSNFLMLRMHNYSRSIGTSDFINHTDKEKLLPCNIQLWLFKSSQMASAIEFNGRKLAVLDLMDTETHQRFAFADKYVLVNGDYYAKLGTTTPANDFDAIMQFFVLSDSKEIEDFVTENKRECLYNLLQRQQIFFGNEVERKAYMDREIELMEKAQDKATIKAQAEEIAADKKELAAKDEALQKAEADKAKAEAEAKAKDAKLQKAPARIKELEEQQKA